MKHQRDPNAFRVRARSYQRWTSPNNATEKSWDEMLNGVMGLTKIDPKTVAGYRVQINFKSDTPVSKSGSVTETP